MLRKFTETAIKRAGNSAGISASEYYITTSSAVAASTPAIAPSDNDDEDSDSVVLVKFGNSGEETNREGVGEHSEGGKEEQGVEHVYVCDDGDGEEIVLQKVPQSRGWTDKARQAGRYTYSQMTCKNVGKFVGGTAGTVLFGATVAAPQLLPLQFLYSAGMAAASVSSDRAGGYVGEQYVRPTMEYWARKREHKREQRVSNVVEYTQVPENGQTNILDSNRLQNIALGDVTP